MTQALARAPEHLCCLLDGGALGLSMRLLFLMLVACSGARPLPLQNTVGATRPQCTPQLVERLVTTLRTRWKVDKLEARCAAGNFGTTGYFLEVRNAALHRTGIVDASGAGLVPFVEEAELEPGTFINGYVTADLDDDGEDEIIESWRRDAYPNLASDNWLAVRRVGGGRFSARIQGPYLSRHHPDLAGACTARWEVRAHAIVVAVKRRPGIPPIDCLPEGRHSFELRGRTLSLR
jgi:hypothetical protein